MSRPAGRVAVSNSDQVFSWQAAAWIG